MHPQQKTSERIMAQAAEIMTPTIERTPIVIDAKAGPTPEQIDVLITNFEAAGRLCAAADKTKDEVKQALLTLIRVFGFPTPNSERSHTINGALNTAMMTVGTSITIHEPAVNALFEILAENGRSEIFPRLFTSRVTHELAPGATEAIKTINLPRRLQEKVQAQYGLCFTPKDTAPRLKVDVLVKEPKVRKPRAKKQAVQG